MIFTVKVWQTQQEYILEMVMFIKNTNILKNNFNLHWVSC